MFVNGCTGTESPSCKNIRGSRNFCNSGCIAQINTNCQIKLPEKGHTLAPWVVIEFKGSGSTITVGNESAPNTNPRNTAVIQSFEFGYHDGLQVRVSIQDQEGGSFVRFMEHLLKDWICTENGTPPAAEMKFQFGWAKAGCNSPLIDASSPCYYALMDSIETSFREGKFVAELGGVDLGKTMMEGVSEQNIGGEGFEGICLVDAVEKLLVQSEPPNVKSVKFRKMQNGVAVPAGFEISHCEGSGGISTNKGPKGKWKASARDKIIVAKSWVDGWRSEDGFGWMMQYNSTIPGGEIIFWEDRRPKCVAEGDAYWDANCVGTYIVNGGKNSPVIEFNPKIKWNFSTLISMGGQITNETGRPHQDPSGGKSSKVPGRRECPTLTRPSQPGAGKTMQTPVGENHKNIHAEAGADELNKGWDAALKALKVLHDDVTADLVIVGDPSLLPPTQAITRNVTIVFINPFHLRAGRGCQDWIISTPPCNEILTNKAWMIKQVTHRIEAGRYTTTLEVYLAAPGKDGDTTQPLGLWTGGWKPPTQC